MPRKPIVLSIAIGLAGFGALSLATPALAAPFDFSVILGDLGINLGNTGMPQQYGYFQPPSAYTNYYSQPLYAQYMMWYLLPAIVLPVLSGAAPTHAGWRTASTASTKPGAVHYR
ncbi:hypothetical protein ACSDBR_09600 [Acidithiobacillus ferriphilus]|uniref:hypothetical protein n=1 Tax=Acidithiobacillus ferriphilus TaxID=1689834 RepID=UPI003F519BFA